MSLDYLKEHEDKYSEINIDELLKLKADRSNWLQHKNNTEYLGAFEELPKIPLVTNDYNLSSVQIGTHEEVSAEEKEHIEKAARKLIPWKKGPFSLFGIDIDAEWRSDFKWKRIKKHLPNLENKKVLDIGCNNGYFMFRMLADNPKLVLGIDPVVQNQLQFDFIQHFCKSEKLKFELFGVEHLPLMKSYFDVIFSMGIIYHHRNPIAQLVELKESLIPGGTAIIETIGIPGDESKALFPEDRYAKMRNVWFVPTLNCLINWAKKANFIDVEVISQSPLTFDEQRLTDWCPPPFQSLKDFLDPNDPTKTIEGHQAPIRFCIKAKRKLGNYSG